MQKIDFAKLEFDDETQERLFAFCKAHRLGLADVDDQSHLKPKDFKFHITVMYSKVTNPEFMEGETDFFSHVVQPVSYDMFGPDLDLLVLRLEADEALTNLFDHYVSRYGHVSDFIPYKPHVTIRGSSAGARERLAALPLPDFELRATRLTHKVKATES